MTRDERRVREQPAPMDLVIRCRYCGHAAAAHGQIGSCRGDTGMACGCPYAYQTVLVTARR